MPLTSCHFPKEQSVNKTNVITAVKAVQLGWLPNEQMWEDFSPQHSIYTDKILIKWHFLVQNCLLLVSDFSLLILKVAGY